MNKIPKTKEVQLTQSERFLIGFKELANECGLIGLRYKPNGGVSDFIFVFNDDSCLHFRNLLVELGCQYAINNGWPNFK